jgi:hypothetical protein
MWVKGLTKHSLASKEISQCGCKMNDLGVKNETFQHRAIFNIHCLCKPNQHLLSIFLFLRAMKFLDLE